MLVIVVESKGVSLIVFFVVFFDWEEMRWFFLSIYDKCVIFRLIFVIYLDVEVVFKFFFLV